MKTMKLLLAAGALLFATAVHAQLFYNNGAQVYVNTNAIVQVNGDLGNAGAAGTLDNLGDVTITGNITNDATAGGNGDYHVAGNWVNNNTFNAGSGSVELNGANQQITGSAETHFYDLLLTGTGVKTLGLDAYVNNLLALNDRELATAANTMFVESSATTAITRTSGFVSSSAGGYLSRATLAAAAYLFPVGSSIGTLRYRPVNLTPASAAANTFIVRMVNNDATTDGYDRSDSDSTICEANPYFYHMVDRTSGSDAADLAINFEAGDGSWTGIGNWNTTATEWQTTGTTSVAANFVIRAGWNNFTYEPYILTTRQANATINPVSALCENIPTITLTAAENGGTWTGTGITSGAAGTFNPATAGAGDHVITYTISGTCGDADQITITIHEVALLSGLTTDESCIDNGDGSIDLTVTGGTSPYTFNWDNAQTTEDISNLAPGTYIVIVNDANNCSVTNTFNILAGTSECIPESFYIPNIFSPNGDLMNDILYVRGNGIKTLKFTIYDRWGEKMFETEDPSTGWDGTFRGKLMESAVFVYTVEAEMKSGNTISEKGNITLVR